MCRQEPHVEHRSARRGQHSRRSRAAYGCLVIQQTARVAVITSTAAERMLCGPYRRRRRPPRNGVCTASCRKCSSICARFPRRRQHEARRARASPSVDQDRKEERAAFHFRHRAGQQAFPRGAGSPDPGSGSARKPSSRTPASRSGWSLNGEWHRVDGLGWDGVERQVSRQGSEGTGPSAVEEHAIVECVVHAVMPKPASDEPAERQSSQRAKHERLEPHRFSESRCNGTPATALPR